MAKQNGKRLRKPKEIKEKVTAAATSVAGLEAASGLCRVRTGHLKPCESCLPDRTTEVWLLSAHSAPSVIVSTSHPCCGYALQR